jgi:hypothetical protein
VQVDTIKIQLKAPGTKRLKPKLDAPLSTLLSNSTCAATPWIAVSLFLAPAKRVSKLAQFHGRALRIYNEKHYEFNRGNEANESKLRDAYLFYPALTEVVGPGISYSKSKYPSTHCLPPFLETYSARLIASSAGP